MRTMIFFSVILGLLSVYAKDAPVEKQATGVIVPPKVICTLKADKDKYEIGEYPKLKFRVQNNSKNKVLLVKVLDGSDCGIRNPLASIQVFDSEGKQVKTLLARCGNTNILKATDFVWIKSGDRTDLSNNWMGLNSGYFQKPGKYKVKINYSTMNDDFRRWTGGPMGPDGVKRVKQECGELFQKREKVNLTAEVEIEIVEKTK